VDLLVRRAKDRSAREGRPLVETLAEVYEFTRVRVARRLIVTGACSLVAAPWDRYRDGSTPRFLCDGSLGGLARWLRAAGYDGRPSRQPGASLVTEAEARGQVLLTSDDLVLDRRSVVEGRLTALWVPSGLNPPDQLGLVLRHFGLGLRAPRCMACGGPLRPVSKSDVAPRIPPRTARWKDEYFVCADCDQLFWEGTHWERISRALAVAS
jgi:uncharacterized protein with PIN domain